MATYGTFVDNVTLKASELNSFFDVVQVTPVIRQPSALNVLNAFAFYYRVNKIVVFRGSVFINTGSGTSGQRVEVDLPIAAASNSMKVIGNGFFHDDSVDNYVRLAAVQFSTTRIAFLTNDANSSTAYLGTTGGPNTALTGNDLFGFIVCYEAA